MYSFIQVGYKNIFDVPLQAYDLKLQMTNRRHDTKMIAIVSGYSVAFDIRRFNTNVPESRVVNC
jgi:hypothetical protein